MTSENPQQPQEGPQNGHASPEIHLRGAAKQPQPRPEGEGDDAETLADAHEKMDHVEDAISKAEDPKELNGLMETIRTRLKSIGPPTQDGGEGLQDLVLGGGGEHNGASTRSTSVPHFHLPSTTASTFRPTTSLQHDNEKMTLMHMDTIILMVSCAFMIIIGLVLRKIFLYVIKVRQRRERYHGGIKAIGEHMHVVTKTMSDAASRAETNNNNNNGAKPKPGEAHRDPKAPRAPRSPKAPSRAIIPDTRRTPEIEIVETDIDADAPPTPAGRATRATLRTKAEVSPSPSLLGRLRMSKPPDPEEIKRQQEERRASRMHNFLANLE